MLFNFANILVFILVGVGFIAVSLVLSRIVQPRFPTAEKEALYECGELARDSAWINYNLRYYLVAVIFIIFDVEIAFVYPVATVFKEWISKDGGAQAWLVFGEVALFVGILLLGLVYVLKKGDLNWFKQVTIREGSRRVTPEEATAISSHSKGA